MALPASGQISLYDIRDELGLTGAFSIQSAAARDFAGIPTGAISLSDFYGLAASGDAQWDGLSNLSYLRVVFTGSATCSITFNSDGTMSKGSGVIGSTPDWLTETGAGFGDDFRIYHTQLTGNTISGHTTEVALSSNRTFSLTTPSGFSRSATVNIRIYHKDSVGPYLGREISFFAESDDGGSILQ